MGKGHAVTEEELEIPVGTSFHVELLERFVAQEGVRATPTLERCVVQGSAAMRGSAWELLAAQNLEVAEQRALQMAAVAGSAPGDERALLLEGLLAVGTPACLDRLAALNEPCELSELLSSAWRRGLAWLPTDHALARARGDEVGWVRRLAFNRLEDAAPAPLLEFCRGLLDDPLLPAPAREQLLDALIKQGDLPTCRRADLSPGRFQRASFQLSPAECFERLAPLVREDPVYLYELLAPLSKQPFDRRWVALALSLPIADLHFSALLALKCDEALKPLLELAEGLPWGPSLKQALHALGGYDDARAAPLMLRWLSTDEGRTATPLLLSSLRGCARREHLPLLQVLAEDDPDHRELYAVTIETIASRSSPLKGST